MGVKLIFFSLLFDFRYLTGYERKEFKANSCKKRRGNGIPLLMTLLIISVIYMRPSLLQDALKSKLKCAERGIQFQFCKAEVSREEGICVRRGSLLKTFK